MNINTGTGLTNGIYTNGITMSVFLFKDSQEFERWDEGVRSIKDEIASINDKRIEGSLTQKQERKVFMDWLDHVKRFTRTYGDARVPDDIKWAVNSVEEGCNVSVTKHCAFKLQTLHVKSSQVQVRVGSSSVLEL